MEKDCYEHIRELTIGLEKLNQEYQNYINGYKNNKKVITHLIHPIKTVKDKINIRKCKQYDEIGLPGQNVKKSYESITKNIVVYTCVLGQYDLVRDPLIHDNSITYILYTDNVDYYSSYLNVWSVRPFPNVIGEIKSITQMNRYIKMHPYELFAEFDCAVYIDGNVRIVSDIRTIVGNVECKTGLAFHRHRQRKCISKEVEVCKLLNKGVKEKLDEQVKHYLKDGYPDDFGMYEATVFCVDLHNSIGKNIFDFWWNEFIKSKSNRDQISLPYSVWKNGYQYNDIGNLGDDLFKDYIFQVSKHA